MEESTINPAAPVRRAPSIGRLGLLALIALLLVAAFFAYRARSTREPASTQVGTDLISAMELEERYGLAVRLIGVTGGGGLVDFRLKILDPDKAREFLQVPANLPRLIVAESGVALLGTEELDEDVSWEEGGILFILFSNGDGAIQSGTPVIVEFGDVQLEPIIAQ
jgi:hypothetical protein